MNITSDTITLAACEKIRADLYQAWQESCEMLALVANSRITTEEAAELANAILAPLQLFPERADIREPQSYRTQKQAGNLSLADGGAR